MKPVTIYTTMMCGYCARAKKLFDEKEVDEGYFANVVEQHAAMIDALASRDADAAEALGRVHTDLFRQRILRAIETNLGQSIDLSSADG